jgi:hypothetical protein
MVLLRADSGPGRDLATRLGLADNELYRPDDGRFQGAACLVLGDAGVGPLDMTNGANPTYHVGASYSLADAAQLTRDWARPKRLRTEAELREELARHERDEKMRREGERQARVKAEAAAREEAQRRASPFARLFELEKKVASWFGETPPPPPNGNT